MDISYSELRQNLKHAIHVVADTHEPMVITSNKKPKAVLLSYEDYRALEETVYLLRSPENARRLLTAIVDVKEGKLIKQGIIQDET